MEDNKDLKCYNCGKTFDTKFNYTRHKNRKFPCLIRDMEPGDKGNPFMCKFCNKILANKGNLHRHYSICKVKNNGMMILAEKIIHEEHVREVEKIKNEIREEFRGELEELKQLVKNNNNAIVKPDNELAQQTPMANYNNVGNNFGVVNNNNKNISNTANFYINPYDRPATDKLDISVDAIVNNDLTKLMFQSLYFNPRIPENHCLYLLNKKEHQLLYHDRDDWKIVRGADNVDEIFKRLANTVAARGGDYLNGPNGPYGGKDANYLALPGVAQNSIREFNEYKNLLSRNSAYEVIIACKDIVKDTIKSSGCTLIK